MRTFTGVKVRQADPADAEFSRRKALGSGSWATLQQLVTLASVAISGIILARHLSLADFGVFSYMTSLAGLGMVIMTAGLSTLAIKAFVVDRDHQARTMTALVVTRELFALFAYVSLLGLSFTSGSSVAVGATAVALLMLFARAWDATEYWFQSRLQSKRTATVRITVVILMLGIRFLLAVVGAGLEAFLIVYVVESVLMSAGILVRYVRDESSPRFGPIELKPPLQLLRRSWMMLVSGLAWQINLRGDIVIMQMILGGASVGIYAAAARLSELFYFLPNVFTTAIFPRMMNIREKFGSNSNQYIRELQRSYDVACWAGMAVSGAVWLLGPRALTLLYGDKFEEAGPVLQAHVLALPFVFMGAVFSQWLVAEDMLASAMVRQVVGAVINICLNLLWIPQVGIIGAAYATLVSYITVSFVGCFLTRSTFRTGQQMAMALLWPCRLAYGAIRRGYRATNVS